MDRSSERFNDCKGKFFTITYKVLKKYNVLKEHKVRSILELLIKEVDLATITSSSVMAANKL